MLLSNFHAHKEAEKTTGTVSKAIRLIILEESSSLLQVLKLFKSHYPDPFIHDLFTTYGIILWITLIYSVQVAGKSIFLTLNSISQ